MFLLIELVDANAVKNEFVLNQSINVGLVAASHLGSLGSLVLGSSFLLRNADLGVQGLDPEQH